MCRSPTRGIQRGFVFVCVLQRGVLQHREQRGVRVSHHCGSSAFPQVRTGDEIPPVLHRDDDDWNRLDLLPRLPALGHAAA